MWKGSKACHIPGTFLPSSEFVQDDQAELSRAKPAGSVLKSLGFCSFFFFFFAPPSRKTNVFSIANSKMARTDTSIHNSDQVFYHMQKD